MKFAKEIESKALPKWRQYYIQYKLLKKVLKPIELARQALAVAGSGASSVATRPLQTSVPPAQPGNVLAPASPGATAAGSPSAVGGSHSASGSALAGAGSSLPSPRDAAAAGDTVVVAVPSSAPVPSSSQAPVAHMTPALLEEVIDRTSRAFVAALQRELDKINGFVEAAQVSLLQQRALLEAVRGGTQPPAALGIPPSSPAETQRAVAAAERRLWLLVTELRDFVELNYIGFYKAGKKHDKVTQRRLLSRLMAAVDAASFMGLLEPLGSLGAGTSRDGRGSVARDSVSARMVGGFALTLGVGARAASEAAAAAAGASSEYSGAEHDDDGGTGTPRSYDPSLQRPYLGVLGGEGDGGGSTPDGSQTPGSSGRGTDAGAPHTPILSSLHPQAVAKAARQLEDITAGRASTVSLLQAVGYAAGGGGGGGAHSTYSDPTSGGRQPQIDGAAENVPITPSATPLLAGAARAGLDVDAGDAFSLGPSMVQAAAAQAAQAAQGAGAWSHSVGARRPLVPSLSLSSDGGGADGGPDDDGGGDGQGGESPEEHVRRRVGSTLRALLRHDSDGSMMDGVGSADSSPVATAQAGSIASTSRTSPFAGNEGEGEEGGGGGGGGAGTNPRASASAAAAASVASPPASFPPLSFVADLRRGAAGVQIAGSSLPSIAEVVVVAGGGGGSGVAHRPPAATATGSAAGSSGEEEEGDGDGGGDGLGDLGGRSSSAVGLPLDGTPRAGRSGGAFGGPVSVGSHVDTVTASSLAAMLRAQTSMRHMNISSPAAQPHGAPFASSHGAVGSTPLASAAAGTPAGAGVGTGATLAPLLPAGVDADTAELADVAPALAAMLSSAGVGGMGSAGGAAAAASSSSSSHRPTRTASSLRDVFAVRPASESAAGATNTPTAAAAAAAASLQSPSSVVLPPALTIPRPTVATEPSAPASPARTFPPTITPITVPATPVSRARAGSAIGGALDFGHLPLPPDQTTTTSTAAAAAAAVPPHRSSTSSVSSMADVHALPAASASSASSTTSGLVHPSGPSVSGVGAVGGGVIDWSGRDPSVIFLLLQQADACLLDGYTFTEAALRVVSPELAGSDAEREKRLAPYSAAALEAQARIRAKAADPSVKLRGLSEAVLASKLELFEKMLAILVRQVEMTFPEGAAALEHLLQGHHVLFGQHMSSRAQAPTRTRIELFQGLLGKRPGIGLPNRGRSGTETASASASAAEWASGASGGSGGEGGPGGPGGGGGGGGGRTSSDGGSAQVLPRPLLRDSSASKRAASTAAGAASPGGGRGRADVARGPSSRSLPRSSSHGSLAVRLGAAATDGKAAAAASDPNAWPEDEGSKPQPRRKRRGSAGDESSSASDVPAAHGWRRAGRSWGIPGVFVVSKEVRPPPPSAAESAIRAPDMSSSGGRRSRSGRAAKDKDGARGQSSTAALLPDSVSIRVGGSDDGGGRRRSSSGALSARAERAEAAVADAASHAGLSAAVARPAPTGTAAHGVSASATHILAAAAAALSSAAHLRPHAASHAQHAGDDDGDGTSPAPSSSLPIPTTQTGLVPFRSPSGMHETHADPRKAIDRYMSSSRLPAGTGIGAGHQPLSASSSRATLNGLGLGLTPSSSAMHMTAGASTSASATRGRSGTGGAGGGGDLHLPPPMPLPGLSYNSLSTLAEGGGWTPSSRNLGGTGWDGAGGGLRPFPSVLDTVAEAGGGGGGGGARGGGKGSKGGGPQPDSGGSSAHAMSPQQQQALFGIFPTPGTANRAGSGPGSGSGGSGSVGGGGGALLDASSLNSALGTTIHVPRMPRWQKALLWVLGLGSSEGGMGHEGGSGSGSGGGGGGGGGGGAHAGGGGGGGGGEGPLSSRAHDPTSGGSLTVRSVLRALYHRWKPPMADWLPEYKWSKYLAADAVAGVTIGIVLIPQGLAYATLAGLPPVYGVYTGFPGAVYSIFGTSKHAAIGPMSIPALLIAAGITALRVPPTTPAAYAAVVMAITFLVGLILLVMGWLHLGFIVRFISRPVLSGFTSAASLLTMLSVVKDLIGVPLPRSAVVQDYLLAIPSALPRTHAPTAVTAVAALLLLYVLPKVKRLKRVPAPLVVVVVFILAFAIIMAATEDDGGRATAAAKEAAAAAAAAALSNATSASAAATAAAGNATLPVAPLPAPSYSTRSGIGLVGVVPGGFPTLAVPHFPSVDVVWELLPTAVSVTFVGFIESIAVAQMYALKYGYDVAPSSELKALGTTNIVGSVVQSFPVMGAFGRSAVNESAGARSQVAGVIAAVVVVLLLLVVMPVLFYLPKPVLAALIVMAVKSLVDISGARKLWAVDRRDFGVMLAALVATLFLGVLQGVVAAMLLSLVIFVATTTQPRVEELGRLSGTVIYRHLGMVGVTKVPEVKIIRFLAPLFFANCAVLKDRLLLELARRKSLPPRLKWRALILCFSSVSQIDSTSIQALEEVLSDAHSQRVPVLIAAPNAAVEATLNDSGFAAKLGGTKMLFRRVHEAVRAVLLRQLTSADLPPVPARAGQDAAAQSASSSSSASAPGTKGGKGKGSLRKRGGGGAAPAAGAGGPAPARTAGERAAALPREALHALLRLAGRDPGRRLEEEDAGGKKRGGKGAAGDSSDDDDDDDDDDEDSDGDGYDGEDYDGGGGRDRQRRAPAAAAAGVGAGAGAGARGGPAPAPRAAPSASSRPAAHAASGAAGAGSTTAEAWPDDHVGGGAGGGGSGGAGAAAGDGDGADPADARLRISVLGKEVKVHVPRWMS
jgi:SulP family sulfate permease